MESRTRDEGRLVGNPEMLHRLVGVDKDDTLLSGISTSLCNILY